MCLAIVLFFGIPRAALGALIFTIAETAAGNVEFGTTGGSLDLGGNTSVEFPGAMVPVWGHSGAEEVRAIPLEGADTATYFFNSTLGFRFSGAANVPVAGTTGLGVFGWEHSGPGSPLTIIAPVSSGANVIIQQISVTLTGQSFATLGITDTSIITVSLPLDTFTIEFLSVPEPSVGPLPFLAGLLCLGYRRRRKHQAGA